MAGRIHHIVYKGSEYRIFITDTRSHILQIHPNETGAAVPLESVWKRLLKEKGLTPLMACNAGMYNENGSAVGLCISNRRLVTKMDTNTSKMPDNFHLYPNGVFYVDSVSGYRVVKTKAMSSILKDSRNITHATQSGPMLLIDGDVHPAFIRKSSNLNVRNGIGVVESSKSRKCVIAISDDRVNFHDFATLFKYVLRCRNALYLDGAISQMVGSDSNPTKIRSGGAYIGPVLSVSEKQSK
jgi:uncharacterized protein YigE (DUF2233 family)